MTEIILKKESSGVHEDEAFESRYLDYVFSEEEKDEMKEKLVHEEIELNKVENEKKSVMKGMNQEIEEHKATIKKLSLLIHSGKEQRYINCKILYNTPNVGAKTIIRTDTDEIIERISMSSNELSLFDK